MLDQVFEQGIWQTVFVGPLRITEHAVKMLLVSRFDSPHGILQGRAHIGWRFTYIVPVASLRDLKAMFIGKVFAVGFNRFLILFIPHIANPLEEEQRQDVAFPVCTVHGTAAQDVCSFPEMVFKSGEGDD